MRAEGGQGEGGGQKKAKKLRAHFMYGPIWGLINLLHGNIIDTHCKLQKSIKRVANFN